jgi:hypothetical protein
MKKESLSKKTLEPTYQVKNHILCFSLTRSRRNKFGYAAHGVFPSMGAFTSSTKKEGLSKKTLDQVYGLC